MAEEADDKSQADDKSKSQADDAADKSKESQADNKDKSQADESLSLETKKKLDKEAKQLRKERDDARLELQKLKDAELSETERLKKQVKDFEDKEKALAAQIRERDARDTIIATLTDDSDSNKLRAKSLNTARAIFKLIKDDLEYSDSGEVLNQQQVLQQAKKDYSDLFAGKPAGSADGGKGNHSDNGVDMNTRIRQAAGRA